MEIFEIEQQRQQVFFNAKYNENVYRFAVSREALEDLARFRRQDGEPDLDRLATFDKHKDVIAKAAFNIITAGFDNQARYIIGSDLVCR